VAGLNPYVSVRAAPDDPLTEALVSAHHVVVFTDAPRDEALRWNAFCRTHSPAPIGFIAADVCGAAGYAFVDFGDAFTVRDPNGEANKSAIVTSITRGNPATVYTVDTQRHGLSEGDYVVFREVEGMTELNDGVPRKVLATTPSSFTLEADTSAWGEHTTGGLVGQVKVPTSVAFASLADRLVAPVPADDPAGMLITPDAGKWGRSEQLHLAFEGLEAYRRTHGTLPPLRDAAAADAVVAATKAFLASIAGKPGALAVEAEEGVARTLALTAAVELPALSAFFGGVVAQEVVKFTGKFSPLRQWLYLDAFEVLLTARDLPATEFAPAGGRYDHVIGLVGRTAQAHIAGQRAFVVGAGALGCELLKDLAMAGVGTAGAGRVTVTDMDRIEVSNLNRQFLFRPKDVGHSKSVTAAAAAAAMNGDLRVAALETPVGEDTEGTFNDEFWGGLDVVINALDNVKARTYVDGRCIFYAKPLLESGTTGTKANTQVVLPRLTECYSDSVDPPEEVFPMCLIKNFPHAIEHCIEWARDLLAGSFTMAVQEAAAFAADPGAWLAKVEEEPNLSVRRSRMAAVHSALTAARSADWAACVATARGLFNAQFYLRIRQLLHSFPADYLDPVTSMKFWTAPKRTPTPAVFDVTDPTHAAFVAHAAALIAANFGVPVPANFADPAALAAILAGVAVAEFVPTSERIKTSETDTTVEGSDDDADVIAGLHRDLAAMAAGGGVAALTLVAADFEKDDDTNHHIDFIAAAANLRARNYAIREATRFDVKLIAGRIIPAIATTTCAVAGLVVLELYKVIAGGTLERARNTFMNLATNMYSMAEPAGPKRTKTVENDPITMGPVKAIPEGFTRWDRIVLEAPNPTPLAINAWLRSTHNIALTMITCGTRILYNPVLYRSHAETRANKAVKAIMEELGGAPITKRYVILGVSCEDDKGTDVVIPPVQVYLS